MPQHYTFKELDEKLEEGTISQALTTEGYIIFAHHDGRQYCSLYDNDGVTLTKIVPKEIECLLRSSW